MNRRQFLGSLFPAIPALKPEKNDLHIPDKGIYVKNQDDRFGKTRLIAGRSHMRFKVSTTDTNGSLFILEHTHFKKGGPARHFHYEQEEWFFVLEGRYIAEVGSERFEMLPGDSLYAPRMIPHAFAFTGDQTGRLLLGFQPAGKMEEHFEYMADQPGYTEDAALLRSRGIARVGPPLQVD